MTDIAERMKAIAAMLPSRSPKSGRATVRDVCLELWGDGSWSCMAGGHPMVTLAEYGGDYGGEGATAEAALNDCARRIIRVPA
jgi:hypothetical protein